MNIELTVHAILRAKQRLNLSPRSLQRTAQKAFDTGTHHEHADDDVKRWALGKIGGKPDFSIHLLGHQAFMFHFNCLITVMTVPLNHRKHLKKQRTIKEEDL